MVILGKEEVKNMNVLLCETFDTGRCIRRSPLIRLSMQHMLVGFKGSCACIMDTCVFITETHVLRNLIVDRA